MISIIIVHYGPVERTQQLIASIQKHAHLGTNYQLIVVDNGSPEPFLKQHASNEPVLIQRTKGTIGGYGAACNIGRGLACYEHLLFLNNDVLFKSDVPSELLASWKSLSSPGVLGPKVFFPSGDFQLSWGFAPGLIAEWLQQRTQKSMQKRGVFWYSIRKSLSRKKRAVDWVSGVAMFTTRQAFDAVSGFDESFPFYYEDADLCKRLRLKGFQVFYDPDVKIYHELSGIQNGVGEESVPNPLKEKIRALKWQGHLQYYRKHRPTWELWVLEHIRRVRG